MKIYKTEDLIERGKSLHIFSTDSCKSPTPPHTHDFIELIYIRSGQAEQYVDGSTYRVSHGDMIFLNYGSSHAFQPMGKFSYVNICFSPETVGDSIITRENAFSLLSLTAFHEICGDAGGGKLSFFGAERAEIENILDAMINEYSAKQASWNAIMESYLNILITKMLRRVEQGMEKDVIGETWQRLAEYIDENLDAELTLSALAQKCFYNPSYFSRVFKENFKMSPVEYVTRNRLEHAVELLSVTELSVDEIGMRVGFSDRSNFYRAFSKYIGGKPSDYRKNDEKVKKCDK